MADGEQHRLNARGAGSRFPEHLYDFVVESPVVWTEAIEYLLEANGRLAHLSNDQNLWMVLGGVT